MSERFTRVYGDVEVVCIDNNKKDDSKFFNDGDYDKFVDTLNEQEEEIQRLKLIINGLTYALTNIKKIDVEIDLNECGDVE